VLGVPDDRPYLRKPLDRLLDLVVEHPPVGDDDHRVKQLFAFPGPPHVHERIVSPVLGFLDDRCEVTESAWVGKDELYRAWVAWSEDRGSEPGSKADFGQALLNANNGIAAARRGPRGAQFTIYTGVRTCS
jgi:hypothetical protein